MEDITKLINEALEKAIKSCEDRDYEYANKICNQILKINPFNSDAWYLSGICNVSMNKKLEAIDCFNQAELTTNVEKNKIKAREMIKCLSN